MTIAYFSMEVGVEAGIPTYAGGLGVLAGDMVRAAADLGLPLVAVTLLHRHGYFQQRLDARGQQSEHPAQWDVEAALEPLPARVTVPVDGHQVVVRAWRRRVVGLGGAIVPVYFLDTDLPDNAPAQRTLTHSLYGGDRAYRLSQEVVLGVGGVRMLRALGHGAIERFHLNEGHSALLVAELLAERLAARGRTAPAAEDVEAVRRLCVFTTHTPVPAAHDQFPLDLAARVLGPAPILRLPERFSYQGALNLTYLALNFSGFVNGVAMRHGEVSRQMYGGYTIDAITNGVHAATWVSPPFAALFDRRIAGWRHDNFSLRYAVSIPRDEIWAAHLEAKARLLARVAASGGGGGFEPGVLTLGVARRASAYKRADLIVANPDRLRQVVGAAGRLQIVFAGKAHPHDVEGKRVIERIAAARDDLRDSVAIVYLEDYDMAQAATITAGVDVWLNTPLPPLEASGTSGMKAALNAVPSLSVLDGWWLEGHVEGVTGWAIGGDGGRTQPSPEAAGDAGLLYDALEHTVLPLYYGHRHGFIDVMRHAIALNGSFFTTQRMLQEYVVRAYGPGVRATPLAETGAGLDAWSVT